MLKEFQEFISKGNVMDLAVGVIIGGAFGLIVSSLVADIIMPIVGAIFGGFDFSNYFLPLSSDGHGDIARRGEEAGRGVCLWQFPHRADQFPDPRLDHLPDGQGREQYAQAARDGKAGRAAGARRPTSRF